jgi:tRNA(adenine34) deaminase
MLFENNRWIAEAINIAKNIRDEVPVCALVVKDGSLISHAVNKVENHNDATLHAEIIAIREASKVLNDWRLNDCTIYTTLEPCSMCMGAILNSRISKVVFGAYDQIAGACGSALNLAYELKKEKQIEIVGGICELQCAELLKSFFADKRLKT